MTDFLPYGRQSISDADVDAVVAALADPFITQGPRVDAFEQALAEAVGARHAIAFANGTAALHGAAAAAGIGEGDEVLTTPISFAASSNCVLFTGGRPVFADIDRDTANLDLTSAEATALLPQVRACVVVSLAGLPADLGPLRTWRAQGLVVIEDAAHALGALRGGRPVGDGREADMTVFSFHPVKAITSGEGGAVTTNDDTFASRLRAFRTHGIVRGGEREDPLHGPWHYDVESLGYNYRITDFQCALGLSQLGRLEAFVTRRNEIAAAYRERLSGLEGVRLPAAAAGEDRHAYHLFVVRLPEGARRRRQVFEALREAGIGTQLHYIPIPAHSLYRKLGYDMVALPEAQAYWEQALSLPIFPDMSDTDVGRVATELERALSRPI